MDTIHFLGRRTSPETGHVWTAIGQIQSMSLIDIKFYLKKQTRKHVFFPWSLHPWKTKMEPQNHPIGKGKSSKTIHLHDFGASKLGFHSSSVEGDLILATLPGWRNEPAPWGEGFDGMRAIDFRVFSFLKKKTAPFFLGGSMVIYKNDYRGSFKISFKNFRYPPVNKCKSINELLGETCTKQTNIYCKRNFLLKISREHFQGISPLWWLPSLKVGEFSMIIYLLFHDNHG